MDWLDDYEDLSAFGERDEEWVQVGTKKKGKKAKNGVNPQRSSLQKEIIDATGQESWWSEPASSNQVDEIDSLPLHPGRTSNQPNFDDYIKSLTVKDVQRTSTSHGATPSHTPPATTKNSSNRQASPLANSNLSRPLPSPHLNQNGTSTKGWLPQQTAERKVIPPPYPPQPVPIPGLVPNPNYQYVQQHQQPQLRANTVVRHPMSYPPPPIHRSIPYAVPPANVGSRGTLPGVGSRPIASQTRKPAPPPIPESLRPWLAAYNFKLACNLCFTKKPDKFGARAFQFYQWPAHKCTNDMILCRPRDVSDTKQPWVIIRPRTNPNHSGAYRICAQYEQETSCRVSHMSCFFAHSEEEMEIWDAERNGEFDRDELRSYLLGANQAQTRKPTSSSNPVPRQTPSGFTQNPTQQGPAAPSRVPYQPTVTFSQSHSYQGQVNSAQTQHQRPAAPSQFPHQSPIAPAQSHLYQGQANYGQTSHQRPAAPSQVPHQSPIAPTQSHGYQGQSNSGQTPHQRPAAPTQVPHQPLIAPAQSHLYQGHANSGQTAHQRPAAPSQVPQQSPIAPAQSHLYQGQFNTGQTPHQRQAGQDPDTLRYQRSTHERFPAFPHQLRAVCRECSESGQHSSVANSHNFCNSPKTHFWKEVAYLASSASGPWVRVAPRPGELRPNIRAMMCNKASACTYQQFTGMPCKFPHSAEEIDLWNYQNDHGLKTVEEVIEVGQQARPESNTVSLSSFLSPAQTRQSDRKHRWKYRDPPFVRSGNFKKCWHDLNNRCKYSQAANNFCGFAHSDGELQEWKQRYQIMKQQRQQATPVRVTADMLRKNEGPFHKPEGPWTTGHEPSPASEVRKDYPGLPPASQTPAPTPSHDARPAVCQPMVINPRAGPTPAEAEKFIAVLPVQPNPLNARYTHLWMFRVNPTDVPGLSQVCFLNGSHMQHFGMSWNKSANGILVSVAFLSSVPGFFQQPLFFDFRPNQGGFRIFLTVFIGQELPLEEETANEEGEQDMDRFPWNSSNSNIVPYPGKTQDPLYERLLRDYPPPPKEDIVFKEREGVSGESFRIYFHKLILLEEKGCNEKISRFFGLHEMTLLSDIRELGAYDSAPPGQLFGKIEVGKQLMNSSDASQIVSKMVNYVLLKFQPSSKVIYQAEICKEGALHQSDEVIYVKVGSQCVADEKLQAGSKLTIQLQFQINRVTFCLLHYGVDHFKELSIAFPERDHGQRFPGVKKSELEDMNPRQESAARYVVGAGKELIFHPGPTLIIGPYGTGKTHTIAKIVIRLLQSQDQNSKILIATHTNSAADWYITEYLHPHLRVHRRDNRSFLTRVHAHDYVNPKSVNQVILENYALVEGDLQSGTRLRKPTLADILRCRVVVTTLTTSIHLVELAELQGKFTHIFIDEAGQALEPETMIPLGLAGPRTVVVLAGDHKQMGPKVHTKACRDRLFHRSMLERLNITSRNQKYRNTCLLSFNYRLRPEILNFITKFYDGDPLIPMGKHLRHPDYYPVTFMEVKGLDQKRGSSYVNAIEAQVLVSAVQKLVADWPSTKWGKFDAKSICVLAPYTLQVKHIRILLRAKQLGSVTVERVQNVQGKQFQVMFISTVRTRNTLKPGEDENKAEEFYHGFLSDEGEIIAACTRAQSLLFVVGDPVALCSVGECKGVWRCYVQECEANGSLLPEGSSVEGIKGEIDALCEPMAEEIPPLGDVRQFNARY